MENSFSSPRSEAFPAGLRVLVVDDDPTWLKILEKMLKKCSYEVTTCGLARHALRLLRERKDGFDIVISDVNMPDMDGFKLLEHVGLEMDLPVIMMSVDGETSRVMKGVQHGACDYLLKPIRMKELKNIWQHVFRKKIHEIRDIEGHESLEALLAMRNGSEHCDEGHFVGLEDSGSARKRKDGETRHDDRDSVVGFDSASAKKARVVWSVDLHQKFVKAVNHIGFEKVGPKKILDLMNVPWLTRENVASHLQKYRLYLTRLQKEKENESKSSLVTTNQSDGPPKEPPHQGGFVLQSSTNTQLIDSGNGSSLIGFNQVSFAAKYSYGEASEIRFRQEQKPLHLEKSFTKLPLPDLVLPRVHVDSKLSSKSTKPVNYTEYGSNQITHNQALEPIYTTSTSAMTIEALNCFSIDFESAQRSLGDDDDDDDFQVLFQGNYNGFSDYTADPVLVNDVPIHLCDSLRFGSEYAYYDPTEYPIIDQSLST